MDHTAAIESIVDIVAGRVTRGFDATRAEWAEEVLRDLIVPSALGGGASLEPGDVDELTSTMLAALDHDDADERYGRLAVAYFGALLDPTADRARELARASLLEGETSIDEGRELMEEVATFVEDLRATAPSLVDYFSYDVEQVLLDCLTAVGETEALSHAMQVEFDHIDRVERPDERVRAPDTGLDEMAAAARASLAVSYEAAEFARRTGLGNREQLLAVRRAYDHAMAVIEDMQRQHGPGAVRRVSDDLVRADLLEVLDVPITADEWEADSTPAGIIRTRLSRDV